MRKTQIIELDDNGNTLRFEIKEMPATKLESWIYRALLCIGPALNIDVPKDGDVDVDAVGKALARNGLKGLLSIDYAKAKPLIDEMLETATRIVDNTVRQPVTIDTVDGYIENVKTLVRLRAECFKVNLGFFLSESQSTSPAGLGRTEGQNPSGIRIPRR